MPNTLGLDDDLDSVELVADLERVFDVTVSDDEAAVTLNVGDFYDLLLKKIPRNDVDRKCASATAFYRVRSAMHRLGYEDRLAPTSDARILERGRTKKNLKRLAAEVDLRMPRAVTTDLGKLAAVGGFLIAAYVLLNFQPSWFLLWIVAAGVVAGVIVGVDRGQLPADCATLGGLAKAVAAENFGRLAKLGARHNEQDIWENLIEVLPHHLLPKSEITRETFFLESTWGAVLPPRRPRGGESA